MKKIIRCHIKTGNIIVSDDWRSYHWLDDPYSGHVLSIHIHGTGDFGVGSDSRAI